MLLERLGNNPKYNKYLWWYCLWYLLTSSLLLLCVSHVFGPVVRKTVWKHECFQIVFWTTSKHVLMQQKSNKEDELNIFLYIFLKERLLLSNDDSLSHLSLSTCGFEPLLFVSVLVSFLGAQLGIMSTRVRTSISHFEIYIRRFWNLKLLLDIYQYVRA